MANRTRPTAPTCSPKCGCSSTTSATASGGGSWPGHLDECAPCLAEYGLEEKLKRLLATKCGGDKAPAALREQIRVAVLQQAEVTLTESADGTTYTKVEVRTTHIERPEVIERS